MPPRTTLDEKRVLLLEGLSSDIQRLEETMRDFKADTKETRTTLTSIQLTLQGISGQELAGRLEKLDSKCFGDGPNSLDNQVRELSNWRWKMIGMGIAAGSSAGGVVGLLVAVISKKLL